MSEPVDTAPRSGKRMLLTQLWRQLPFFFWLIALWMLLWGQFTWVAFLTGVIAAVLSMNVLLGL